MYGTASFSHLTILWLHFIESSEDRRWRKVKRGIYVIVAVSTMIIGILQLFKL